jgi:hypothetical protein
MAGYQVSETEKGPVVGTPTEESSHTTVVDHTHVLGTVDLYVNGKRKLVPVPSPDPNDPLNMPPWKKWMAVASLCLCKSSFVLILQDCMLTGTLQYSWCRWIDCADGCCLYASHFPA